MIAVIETGAIEKATNYISDILISGVLGGNKVSEIYLREKTLDNESYISLAEKVIKLIKNSGNILKADKSCDEYNGYDLNQVKLTVNYRDGLAYNISADTVHFSFSDFIKCDLFPDNITKSVSVHSVEEAMLAEKKGADRLMTGHIFVTKCKNTEPRGLEYLSDIVRAVRIPVIAIGGITTDNYMSAFRAGASDIAVMNSWRETD